MAVYKSDSQNSFGMTRVFARTFLPSQSRQSITQADTKGACPIGSPAFSSEIALGEALADHDRGGVLDVDQKPRERLASDVDVNRLGSA
jgi:hypothetical protein